jgi:hypothetical protein
VYRDGLGKGHRITVGGEFGHETICRVAEVGKNVTDVKPCPKWEESIYHVDDKITDKVAALIEPFTVGCRRR